jgi:hypothetical protein
MKFIEKKVAGGESVDDVVQPDDGDDDGADGKILNLADYLERSFKKPPGTGSKSKPARKRTATKKDAAKESTSRKPRRSA